MTFEDFQKICENDLDTVKLADIARELDVTPQVINNWKIKNQVPHKYVKIVKNKIRESNDRDRSRLHDQIIHTTGLVGKGNHEEDSFELLLFLVKDVFNSVKRNRTIFIIIPTLTIILALFKVASLDPIFISETKIIPSGTDSNPASQLQSLASNFGISTGNTSTGSMTSANLFPEVIKSRRLARAILKRNFNTDRYGKNKPLVSILTGVLDVQEDDDILMKTGISDLTSRITVTPIPNTPLLIIQVIAFEPQLAADIATAIVEELNFLQILFKSSRIKEKKVFIQDRIKDVEKELIKAEEALKYYRETNRNIQKSPSLLLKQERYKREVGTQVQLYQTLKSQFEIAQIELVEKSNMVDVLDPAEAPLYKTGPKRRMIMIIVTIFSIIFSTAVVYILELSKEKLFSKK